jgi:Monooxygenase af470-like
MSNIFNGRYTADAEDDLVVFLIGMRINNYWAVHKWMPVAMAMAPMMKSLSENPESGFLSAEGFTNLRTTCLLQYWRSFDHLERFSKDPGDTHRAAWQKFNRAVGSHGVVGIWHETYKIRAREYECVYGNMPLFGLAKATRQIPAEGKWAKARSRISMGKDVSKCPVPEAAL